MKILVIFYSLDGNTKLIAETIASQINADILELKPKDEIKKTGFMKYFWGGRAVMMKKIPELNPFDKNLDDYQILVFGTPVWAWSFAPALRAFFLKEEIKDKKIALFCCHGGGPGKTIDKMKEELEGNAFLGSIEFCEPLRNDREGNIKKAEEWIAEICR